MGEIKTVLIVATLLSAATGSRIYQVNPRKKMRHHSEIKSQSPCKKEYKKICFNSGECYYLVDEDILACNFTSFHGGKRCEKYMWWT